MEANFTTWCNIINQLYTLELRTRQLQEKDFYQRRFERVRQLFQEMNIYIHDPLGEAYASTRTDCEAILQGNATEGWTIVEVIKPIIYYRTHDNNRMIQAGVVMIEGKA